MRALSQCHAKRSEQEEVLVTLGVSGESDSQHPKQVVVPQKLQTPSSWLRFVLSKSEISWLSMVSVCRQPEHLSSDMLVVDRSIEFLSSLRSICSISKVGESVPALATVLGGVE